MPSHEIQTCPRCQTSFECKVGTINICQCKAVTTTPEEINFMQTQYKNCLCASCMEVLKQVYHQERLNNKLNPLLRKQINKKGKKH